MIAFWEDFKNVAAFLWEFGYISIPVFIAILLLFIKFTPRFSLFTFGYQNKFNDFIRE